LVAVIGNRLDSPSGEDLKGLRYVAATIRSDILETLYNVGSGHSGPSLSIVELLVALYFAEMRVRPDEPDWPERDRFVLSKGHGALALYCVMGRAGFFPMSDLESFEYLGSHLQGHPDCRTTPGVEMSTGSLGQGLSVSIGHALGARRLGLDMRAYCLLGDGEVQEGNVWEAAMAAAKFQLDGLVAIIDQNGLQGGITAEVMPSLEPLADKWRAFGWHVLEIDGHDLGQIVAALTSARSHKGQPSVIIAHTVKGKGISFMEGNVSWHSGTVGKDEYERAKPEIDAALAEAQA
jgi:transketolase